MLLIYLVQGKSSYDMTPARHELPPEPLKDENDYGGWEAAVVFVVGDGRAVVVVVVVMVVMGGMVVVVDVVVGGRVFD